MEGKLLNVCVILCGCWAWPSSVSLLQLASPVNPATPPHSSWLHQSSLTNSPRLQQFPLTTSPGLHQSSLTTSPGLQQSLLTTSPGLHQSSLTTSPGLQQSPITTSPGLQQSLLTTSPGLHQSSLTTSPGLQQSPLTTSPGLQQSLLTTNLELQQSPLTTSPGLQQSLLTTNPGLQQSPLTTSPGPARSPRQHPPLVSNRDVPLTGNTPMGETQSSGQNPLQPIVSHLHPDMTLLRRKKRKDCFSEAVRVSNNLKEVMKTDQQNGTLYFYPEDDFEFVRFILIVTHGEQEGVFNKEHLCVDDGPRWYTLEFSAGHYHIPQKVDTWGIYVKVDNCKNKSPIDYLHWANRFYHMRVVAKGSSYWSTRAPGPDCLNPFPDHTTAGGEPGTPVSTLPPAADDTQALVEQALVEQALVDCTILPVVVLTIVFTVDLVIVVIWCRSRKGRTSKLGGPPESLTHPSGASDTPMYDEVRI
ncbi:uncharacterized protein [Procambarus clarkii]|uniref:uncharacterized protein isoform X1 n=1 Tax=Procambarus clarkii TaxID=6728 RepID=UPI0037443627